MRCGYIPKGGIAQTVAAKGDARRLAFRNSALACEEIYGDRPSRRGSGWVCLSVEGACVYMVVSVP